MIHFNVIFHFLLGSTYGSASYGAGIYSAAGTNGAPSLLPNTGAGWAMLLGIAALAIASGVITWLLQNRKRFKGENSSSTGING
jgi:LPXTG-motif cell wall-anchored protein